METLTRTTWTRSGQVASTPGSTPASTVSYDSDGDGLIEISTLAQLNAVRWDLDGDGAADNGANESSYATAFPICRRGHGLPHHLRRCRRQ